MEINLGRAIDFFYPTSSSLELVYFEAIANAIDAGANKIQVIISVDAYSEPESLTITICDNGEGFTDERYRKFSKLLETEEEDHKGLGRLVFLKYFKKVEIESIFGNQSRKFTFEKNFDKNNFTLTPIAVSTLTGSILRFSGYLKQKLYSYDFLKPVSIKQSLLYHFYPHLFSITKSEKDLAIEVELTTQKPNPEQGFYNDTQRLIASQSVDLESKSFPAEGLDLFETIDLFYKIKLTNRESSLVTAICVDGRTIPIDIMSRESTPRGYEIVFLLYSDFFTGKTNPSREALTLDEQELKVVKNLFRKNATIILNEKIPSIQTENKQITESLNNNYPHLTGYFDEQPIGIIDRNKAIEVAQRKFFQDQKEVLDGANTVSKEQYEKALNISSRTLMEYILYRNVIIKNLKGIDYKNTEADIHDIIVPRKKICTKSDLINDLYTNNAWLLDDKYMSYSTILSDLEINKLMPHLALDRESVEDEKRPDITIVFSNDVKSEESTQSDGANQQKIDVVIVELKKLGLPLAKREEIVSQLKQRARKLANYYPDKIQRIWFYGIVDIDKEFRISLKEEQYTELFSAGSMFYKEHSVIIDEEKDIRIPVGLYVLSFETFLKDAEIRNSTFLNVLKQGFAKGREKLNDTDTPQE
ncbi:ATPase [Bacteroidia bacterium]|nr:ATPase [Bacteroidia bacterium]